MNNILYNTDCNIYMKDIPDGYFDLCIADPPYGIGVNISMGRRKGDMKSSYHKYAGEDKEAPEKEYFIELERISVNQIIWGANHFIENIPNANTKNWIIWNKLFHNDVSFASAELAWSNIDATVKIYTESPNNHNRIHPTQKPVALYKWLLTNYAKPGYKLFDSHSGSGSFRIAAYDMGFDLVSCELDADYCRDNEARFQRHIQQIDLFKPEEIQEKIYQEQELFN